MILKLLVPEDIAEKLAGKWHDLPKRASERVAVEAYRDGRSTAHEVRPVPGHTSQTHGFFGSDDTAFDTERVGFFDDSLLIAGHGAQDNWRQQPHPAEQLFLHRRHGWGGEAFWDLCNRFGWWVLPPRDRGNVETLGAEAERIGLNYMLGSPAFSEVDFSSAEFLAASQTMGYKFTATGAARQDPGHFSVTVENTGAAYCPYKVEVCTEQGCGGNLSTLAPGTRVVVSVPASAAESQTLFFTSPRLDPASPLKIRWSNAGADGAAGTLTVVVADAEQIFADGFESGSAGAWAGSTP